MMVFLSGTWSQMTSGIGGFATAVYAPLAVPELKPHTNWLVLRTGDNLRLNMRNDEPT